MDARKDLTFAPTTVLNDHMVGNTNNALTPRVRYGEGSRSSWRERLFLLDFSKLTESDDPSVASLATTMCRSLDKLYRLGRQVDATPMGEARDRHILAYEREAKYIAKCCMDGLEKTGRS